MQLRAVSNNIVQNDERTVLTRERKFYLLKVLKRDGRVVAKDESERLDVSEDTIRRDLRGLASEGRLQRVHGGALPASPALANFAGRQSVAPQGKVAIGRTAARLVRPGQVIFLDGGTTAVQLARHLPIDLKATVVTHSASIAVELVSHPGVDVELIGGRLFKHSIVSVGATAVEAIARIRADVYFMGVTGIHPDSGLTTGDLEEAAVKRALSSHAAETVVLASREKFGTASPFLVVPLDEVGTFVVEDDLPDAVLKPYRKLGIAIVSERSLGRTR